MLTRPVDLLRRMSAIARRDEGQTAWGFLLGIIVIFMFFAVAFDAGLWVFDHRTAQNQAESAALAAAQELPASDTTEARAKAEQWLARNGVDPTTEGCSPDWITFTDVTGEGEYDQARVCLSRSSSAVFAALSQVTDAEVSASATALIGRTSVAQVMPWAVVPPDPDCDTGETCEYDENGDGDFTDPGECRDDFDDCPWGINPDNLFAFKSGGGGNTGIIDACGNGANGYKACISGENASGFFEEGTEVVVGLQGGNLGANTNSALTDRYDEEADLGGWICDVAATPDPLTGYDPDGRAEAYQRFDTAPPERFCRERLVLVPIIASMPPQGGGSASLEVLGVATFGIASWNRSNNKDAYGTTADECSISTDDSGFGCGMVWGYLMENLQPPDVLLQRITNSDNPFAPLLIALVE